MTKQQEQNLFNHFSNKHNVLLMVSDFHAIEAARGNRDKLTQHFWNEQGHVLDVEDFRVINENT